MDPVRAAGISIMAPVKKNGAKSSVAASTDSNGLGADKAEISSEALAQLDALGIAGGNKAEDARMVEHLDVVRKRLESGAYDSGMVTDYIARALLARGDV